MSEGKRTLGSLELINHKRETFCTGQLDDELNCSLRIRAQMPEALESDADRRLMVSKCVFGELREEALLLLLPALSNPKLDKALA